MSGNDRSAKDKSMAAFLSANHVRRTAGTCPICHYLVGLEHHMEAHLRMCPGRPRQVRAVRA